MAITYAPGVLAKKAGHFGLCNQLQMEYQVSLTTSKSAIKPEIRLCKPKELHKDEELFIAIHRHEYGMTHVVFACNSSIEELSHILAGDNAQELAERLGLDFEPDRDEELMIDTLDVEVSVVSAQKLVEVATEVSDAE